MTQWHTLTPAEVSAELDTSPDGLTAEVVDARLHEYGRNELPAAQPPSAWRVLLNQFLSPMVGFLIVCAVITAVEGEWVDTGAIITILTLNAAVGFWQERKAERDVRALQQLSSTTARVVRAGDTHEIDAAEVVPGDLILVESGDRIPADLRITDTTALRVDESMLTGEVLPANKATDPVAADQALADRENMAFSGTLVVSGRGTGVAVATGTHTELGEINELIQGPVGKTPLQILTDRLEKMIGLFILLITVALFIAGLVLGRDLSEMFRTSVALIVSALPEALPVVLTVALGAGVSQMAKRGAIVRRLPSVETLGSTTVIGSDKTGTLTQNRLTVEAVWTTTGHAGCDPDELTALQHRTLRAGAATNEARHSADGWTGDAVDIAIASAAVDAQSVNLDELPAPVADMPYEPDLAYSQTLRVIDGRHILFVKGAPERLLEFSQWMATTDGDVPIDTSLVVAANEAMAADGLRVIATAEAEVDKAYGADGELPPPSGLTLLGLAGMVDPPRPGVPEAIQNCRDAGIRVMMITGDHPITATAIGRRLGLDTSTTPITGAAMATLDDDELLAKLGKTAIAARMTPQDKLRIVTLLKQRGDTVAVTGDGVNDAPALRAASIGVAMGKSGTEVAREASDVVLTDDNFVTIVDAVEQGRVTFAAIRKATFFLLSSALATMLAVAVNTFTEHPLIFLPVMLLWMNIVMNGLQDMAMAFEPGEGDELQQSPRPAGEGVLNNAMWFRVALTGVCMGIVTLVVYGRALDAGYAVEHARTMALTTMVMANFFQILNSRTERMSIFKINHLRNPFLGIASVGAVVVHFLAMSWDVSAGLLGVVPLSGREWLVCAVLGSSLLLIVEVEKAIRRRLHAKHTEPQHPRASDEGEQRAVQMATRITRSTSQRA